MEHRDPTLEASFQSWKGRRPQLFSHSSTRDQMASNTVAHIAAIADGQEKTVQLPRTRYDSTLTKSIISKDRARATKGTLKPIPKLSLVDSTGHIHTSIATISARWHLHGGAQSFSETFYVVDSDSLGQYDAMLRKDIARVEADSESPHVYAFMMEKESQAEREVKKARERARVKEMEAAKARSEGRVRAQYEQKKGELAKRRG